MALTPQDFDRLDKRVPVARWQYVTVTFLAPDTDTPVLHTLGKVEPESIRWYPIAVEGDAYLYRAPQGTRKAFTGTTLWLRASDACTTRLLLLSEQPT